MLRSFTGLIILFGCSTAMAVTNTTPTSPSVGTPLLLSIPPSVGLWTVGVEAQLMMPIDAFQYMGTVYPVGSDTFHHESVDNQKDLGWGADLAYQFPGSGTDVRVAYTDLNMSDTEEFDQAPGEPMSGIGSVGSGLFFPEGDTAIGVATYRYRSGDLTAGQLFNIGTRLSFHPFAGLRYAYINVLGDANYQDEESNAASFDSDSKFNGLGPRLGMDITVNLWKGFSLVGTVGTAILAGDINEDYKVDTTTSTITNYDQDGNFTIVPELDGSIGVQYQHQMTAKTNFAVQLGAQVVNYFNADQHDFNDALITNSDTGSENFGYHGYYLRAQMSMA